MIPLPPISTLFPYTTLFRSKCEKYKISSIEKISWSVYHCLHTKINRGGLKLTYQKKPDAPLFRDPIYDGAADPTIIWNQDRKSTRLNSSHVAISYAVFCLKK